MNFRNLISKPIKLINYSKVFRLDIFKYLLMRYCPEIFRGGIVGINSIYGKYYVIPSKTSAYFLIEILVRKNYPLSYFDEEITVLDLGANQGIFSVYAAKNFDANVIAVEPVKENFDIAMKNIRENKIESKVIMLKKAVWNKDGETIKIFLDSTNLGTHSAYKSWFSERKQEGAFETVETISFSTLLRKYKPNYIKCDIEGSEWEIFSDENREVKELLRKYVKYISMEVHLMDGKNVKDMKRFFEELGYTTIISEIGEGVKAVMLYAKRL